MNTTGIRIYGKNDLRMETYTLPDITEEEIRAKIYTNTICMSTHKLTKMGQEHGRAPQNMKENPALTGHEFCGVIEEVGEKWKSSFKVGQKFILESDFNIEGSTLAPGFSFPYIGGNAVRVNIPAVVMERDCLLVYEGDGYFLASLTEPTACIICALNASYHIKQGTNRHIMGLKKNGKMAILAGCGPMGLNAIDCAIHGENPPSLLVVTDVNKERLQRAEGVFTKRSGSTQLYFVNPNEEPDFEKNMVELTQGGFDDIFVMAPVPGVLSQADRLLGEDGCLNFFSGPTDTQLTAEINFYKLHYEGHHFVGTTGSHLEDMKEALRMIREKRIDPRYMITHIGGINAVVDTIKNLPNIPGGKKLIYPDLQMPLTALNDFKELGKENENFAELAKLIEKEGGVWSLEAEEYLLEHLEGFQ